MDGINAFTCLCLPGFTGSYCQYDINECDSKPCLNGGTCLDSYGTYKCTCPHGYTGINCQVRKRQTLRTQEKGPLVCAASVNRFASWFFRIWCAGAIRPRVRTEAPAGSREPRTPASVRLDGPASTATSPVCPVRSQPNSKVHANTRDRSYTLDVQNSV